MKPSASVAAAALAFAALAALTTEARADEHARVGAVPSTVTRTADYTEQNLSGDQVVKFTGDELVGPAGGAYGDVIRRPPGVTRLFLIRPRLNFIPELVKTVENL